MVPKNSCSTVSIVLVAWFLWVLQSDAQSTCQTRSVSDQTRAQYRGRLGDGPGLPNSRGILIYMVYTLGLIIGSTFYVFRWPNSPLRVRLDQLCIQNSNFFKILFQRKIWG